MGAVIEICVKYPGGSTRNKGTDIIRTAYSLAHGFIFIDCDLRTSTSYQYQEAYCYSMIEGSSPPHIIKYSNTSDPFVTTRYSNIY